MKTKTIIIAGGVLAGAGLLYWAFTRDTTTTTTGVHVPKESATGGKGWIADVINAAGGASSSILDSLGNWWRTTSPETVDDYSTGNLYKG